MKKKILMISFRFPFPEWKGGFNLRVLKLARILAQKYSLDYLTLTKTREEERDVKNLEKEKIFENIFHFFHPKTNEYKNAFQGIFSNLPLQVNYYYSRSAIKWLEENYTKYDLLYFNTIRTTEWGENLKKIPRVVDLIDAVSLNYLRAKKWGNFLWKMIYGIEIPRLIRYESKILKERKFDNFFISSLYDKNYLAQQSKIQNIESEITVIPNGVKEELFQYSVMDNQNEKENWVAFFGKMDTRPNEDAVIFFAKEVMPLIDDSQKPVFYIVGANPTASVKKLEKIQNVKVTGYLENPYKILQKSKIIVSPLRFGAGIQNKILEAMAMEKAIITSVIGTRGIEGAMAGKHFEVLPINAGLWAKKVVELISDFPTRERLGKEAKKLIEEKYRWEKIGNNLLTEVEKKLN